MATFGHTKDSSGLGHHPGTHTYCHAKPRYHGLTADRSGYLHEVEFEVQNNLEGRRDRHEAQVEEYCSYRTNTILAMMVQF